MSDVTPLNLHFQYFFLFESANGEVLIAGAGKTFLRYLPLLAIFSIPLTAFDQLPCDR